MKVIRIELIPVRVPLARPLISAKARIDCIYAVVLLVETDAGLVGENLVWLLDQRQIGVVIAMIKSFEQVVVGKDPSYSEGVGRELRDVSWFLGPKGVTTVAVHAIDGALWDLRAKASELPMHRLIGACRDSVPTYASASLWISSTIDELAYEAQNLLDQGFKAMKMRVGGTNAIATDVERVRIVREAIGPTIPLMADATQSLDPSRAIRLGRELEAFDLCWFEEPLTPTDHRGSAKVAAALDMPLCSGESEYTLLGFREMLELQAADIIMPDLQRVGGLGEFLKVGHLAEAFNIPVASHVFTEMSLPILAALPNSCWLEHVPWLEPLYQQQMTLRNGEAVTSNLPGWGFAFDRPAIKRLRLD